MTDAARIHSVHSFADALFAVVAEYMAHLEPSADPTIYSVRLEANGPHLTVTYEKSGDNPAGLTVSMPAAPKPEQQQKAERGDGRGEKKGVFS